MVIVASDSWLEGSAHAAQGQGRGCDGRGAWDRARDRAPAGASRRAGGRERLRRHGSRVRRRSRAGGGGRSEEHTSELQSRLHLVCRLLLEKKKKEQREDALAVWCA